MPSPFPEDAAEDWIVDGARARMVNLAIAEAGYARALPIPPNLVYADLFRDAVRSARKREVGMWGSGSAAGNDARDSSTAPVLPPGAIVIACALYDPGVPNEIDAETVTLLLRERIDTRGYYLHDRGSGTVLPLPPGERGPGELAVRNPGPGIWNNGGDTIHLERAGTAIDEWGLQPLGLGHGLELEREIHVPRIPVPASEQGQPTVSDRPPPGCPRPPRTWADPGLPSRTPSPLRRPRSRGSPRTSRRTRSAHRAADP